MSGRRLLPILGGVGIIGALVGVLVGRHGSTAQGGEEAGRPAPLQGMARFVGSWTATDAKRSGDCAPSQDPVAMVVRQTGPTEIVLTTGGERSKCEVSLRVDGSLASTPSATCQLGKATGPSATFSDVRMRTEDGHSGEVDLQMALHYTKEGVAQSCTTTLHATLARS